MNSPYRLYDASNEPKQIWVEQGVRIWECWKITSKYKDQVIGFFDQWLFGKINMNYRQAIFLP
jgi:hypothetical protein